MNTRAEASRSPNKIAILGRSKGGRQQTKVVQTPLKPKVSGDVSPKTPLKVNMEDFESDDEGRSGSPATPDH